MFVQRSTWLLSCRCIKGRSRENSTEDIAVIQQERWLGPRPVIAAVRTGGFWTYLKIVCGISWQIRCGNGRKKKRSILILSVFFFLPGNCHQSRMEKSTDRFWGDDYKLNLVYPEFKTFIINKIKSIKTPVSAS